MVGINIGIEILKIYLFCFLMINWYLGKIYEFLFICFLFCYREFKYLNVRVGEFLKKLFKVLVLYYYGRFLGLKGKGSVFKVIVLFVVYRVR